MILCSNPLAQYLSRKKEIDLAINRVLRKGRYILGEEVKTFEKEFAGYIGVAYGTGVGSGTEALHIALLACGIGQGDEVITVSHTAVATVSAIESTGARPVFVDIDPVSYTIDVEKIKKAITRRTKAIIPVHIYGKSADMGPIIKIGSRYGIRIIEDCAQAHGAKYKGRRVGSLGEISCFSFYPTKNLGAVGDGGAIVTSDKELAGRLRMLREYGWRKRFVSEMAGINARLDELQAAVLRVKLRYLDRENSRRKEIARVYDNLFSVAPVIIPKVKVKVEHAYHHYVISSPRRDELQRFLGQNGIGTGVYYPLPIHLQPAYKGRCSISGDLSNTEDACRKVLSLPMYPHLSDEEARWVCRAINLWGSRAKII